MSYLPGGVEVPLVVDWVVEAIMMVVLEGRCKSLRE